MKRKPYHRICYTVIFAIAAFLYSCETDLDLDVKKEPLTAIKEQSLAKEESVEVIKQKFSASNLKLKLINRINDTTQLHWEPNWESTSQRTINDTLTYTYIPLQAYIRSTTTNDIVGNFIKGDNKEYLIVKSYSSKVEFYRANYIFDKQASKNNVKDFKSFSGVLLLYDFISEVPEQQIYKNGKRLTLSSEKTSGELGASGYVTVCSYNYECLWVRSCSTSNSAGWGRELNI